MHPANGLRAIVDVDQIALHEWGAARASAAVWRMIAAAWPGTSELEATRAMGYAGEILTTHVLLATAGADGEVIGLRSRGGRVLQAGDGASAAVGYWGGLSARAGLIAEHDDAFLELAKGYFAGLAAWYATADNGVAGERSSTLLRRRSRAPISAPRSIPGTSPATTSGCIRRCGADRRKRSPRGCRSRRTSFRRPCRADGR